jgi:predicted secreted acid phosphatase
MPLRTPVKPFFSVALDIDETIFDLDRIGFQVRT